MFQRFTDRARRVVVLAQHEARRLGHDSIGTEHLLLGLIDEGRGVATTALTSMGIDLDEMRQAVQDSIGRGAEPAPESGHDRARQQVIVLLYGRREAGSAAVPPPPAADELMGRLTSIVGRLNAIEQRLRRSPPA
jgi:ATP-dependent Clp protease ATP-binding subunit ClpC